jgi:nucleotide-binding universal stress UspA family protein
MAKSENFETIILAVDGSGISKKAAKKAFFLAKKLGITVTAIHVTQNPIYMIPEPQTNTMSEIDSIIKTHGEKILKETGNMGTKMGVTVKKVLIEKVLIEGVPYEEIIKKANKEDLIILGCKGHSTLNRILIGSVSENVLHHSNATVMIVR